MVHHGWLKYGNFGIFNPSESTLNPHQRSVDMDTNFVDTGVHVHVTDMDVDMDT